MIQIGALILFFIAVKIILVWQENKDYCSHCGYILDNDYCTNCLRNKR